MRLLGNQVAFKPYDPNHKKTSLLISPDTLPAHPTGIITAVGPKCEGVAVGDYILFEDHALVRASAVSRCEEHDLEAIIPQNDVKAVLTEAEIEFMYRRPILDVPEPSGIVTALA